MSYTAYPSYKDSGIEWLEGIPNHWQTLRLRYIQQTNPPKAEISYLSSDTEVSFVPMEAVGEYGGMSLEQTKPLADVLSGYTYFRDDDIVVAKITPCFENGKGTQAKDLVNGIGFGTTELHVMRPKPNVNPRFLFYLSISHTFRKLGEGEMYGAGGQKRVPEDFVRNFVHPIPPIEEQSAIVNFLDQETAKVDALITKQQQLIETLQEKRKTLILYVVTKGLNPHAPLKDSGIEWIGRVPTHWPVMRNKVVFREVDERSILGDEELLTVSHITGVTPRSEKNVNMFLAESLVGYKKCKRSDLIINTMWAWMGALGLSQYEGVISPSYNVYRLRSKSMVNPKYLDFLYRTPAHIVEINRYSKGVWESRMRLYPDAFFTMQIALPPREEQDAIVDYLGKQLKLMDALEEKCQKAIELLQERRTSLISAAVTGKIDVRVYGNHEP